MEFVENLAQTDRAILGDTERDDGDVPQELRFMITTTETRSLTDTLPGSAIDPHCSYVTGEQAGEDKLQLTWAEKMEELEAIHREIAPQVFAMREALDDNDPENCAPEIELHYCESKF